MFELFYIPAFRTLFAAQIIALIGTGLTTIALALLAFELAGNQAGIVLGTALAIKMIAYVFISPLITGLIGNNYRKLYLIVFDLMRAFAVILLFFVFLLLLLDHLCADVESFHCFYLFQLMHGSNGNYLNHGRQTVY